MRVRVSFESVIELNRLVSLVKRAYDTIKKKKMKEVGTSFIFFFHNLQV